MESPLLTWVIITFGVFFCFVVVSQQNVDGQQLPWMPKEFQDNADEDIVPAPPPPPPPPLLPPPSPPPPPPPPPPPSYSPPPPPSPHSPHHPPPPPRKGLPLAPTKNGTSARNHNNDHNPRNAPGKFSPPPKEKKLNFGMKIGLFFVGIAAILQVCVVAFLVINRRQLLRAESRF